MNVQSINIDKSRKIKLYFQLYNELANAIKSGALQSGEQIPSIRIISSELNISRNTVTKAYQMLEDDGYIRASAKSGFYVLGVGERYKHRILKKEEEPKVQEETAAPETESIPTVDSIVKQRMGNIIQNSPFEENEDISIKDLADSFSKKETAEAKPQPSLPENPQTLSDLLLVSYHRVIESSHDLFSADAPAFGLQELRKTICSLVQQKRGLSLGSDRIIVASTEQELFGMLLSLDTLSQPFPVRTPRPNGLLLRAEQVNNGETTYQVKSAVLLPKERPADLDIHIKAIPDSIDLFEYDDATRDVPQDYGWVVEVDKMIPEDNSLDIPYRNILSQVPRAAAADDRIIYLCRCVNCSFMVIPAALQKELRAKYSERISTLSMMDQLVLCDVLAALK